MGWAPQARNLSRAEEVVEIQVLVEQALKVDEARLLWVIEEQLVLWSPSLNERHRRPRPYRCLPESSSVLAFPQRITLLIEARLPWRVKSLLQYHCCSSHDLHSAQAAPGLQVLSFLEPEVLLILVLRLRLQMSCLPVALNGHW